MIRVTKGGFTFECETQADVRLAMGVFTTVDVPPLPDMMVPDIMMAEAVSQAVSNTPNWTAEYLTTDKYYPVKCYDPVNGATESNDSTHLVSVGSLQLDVLEAVMLFPEGVPCKGIQQLLGLTGKQANSRIQTLRREGLVERIPKSTRWRATTFARRAKLVRA